jgi:glycosyltransferase involved in cell wall biosynthesis
MIPLVIFSSQDFDDLPTRKHRLAGWMSVKGNPTLYIEAPFTYLSALKDPTYRPKVKRAGQIRKIHDNLWVASPPAMMPFYGRYGICQNMAAGKIANFARSVMKKIGFPKEFVALFYLPWMEPIIQSVKPKASFYDCVDDHAGYGGTSSKTFIESAEARLCENVSAVFATAKSIAIRLSSFNRNTVYMPNAVDPDLFTSDGESELTKYIAKPQIVYAGALRWWFDSQLMLGLAKSRPKYSFLIIGEERNGELGADGQALRSLPNVHFLGKKPQSELPGLMAEAACGIIPFKTGPLIASVSPLKLYEYASMGLHTVSVPMMELETMPNQVVTKAEGLEKFTEALDRAVANPPDRQALKAFVNANTWESRMNRFYSEFERQWQKR